MNNTILKNTLMLYLVNIARIIFPLVTLPYLTRVLTVECFGVVAYVKALMQYMQIFVDFGFMLSGTKDIALCRDDREKLNNETTEILLARITISIVALVVLLMITSYISLLNNNKIFTLLSFTAVFLSCFSWTISSVD